MLCMYAPSKISISSLDASTEKLRQSCIDLCYVPAHIGWKYLQLVREMFEKSRRVKHFVVEFTIQLIQGNLSPEHSALSTLGISVNYH